MRDFVENAKNKTDFQTIKRIFSFIKNHKKKVIVAIVLMLFLVVINIIPPMILSYTVYVTTSPTISIVNKHLFLIFLIVGYVIMIALSHFFAYKQTMILQLLGQSIVYDLRAKTFSHIELLGLNDFNIVPVGKLMTRVCNDSAAISEMYSSVLINLISNFLKLFAILIIMFIYSFKLTLICLATIPLAIGATILFRVCVKSNFRKMRNNISELNAFLSENLHGMKVTQIFCQEENRLQEFKKRNRAIKRNWNIQIVCFAIYRPIIYAISIVGVLLAIYFGANSTWVAISSLYLISYQQYIRDFYGPLEQLSEQFNVIQDSFSSAEKIFDVLDTPIQSDLPDSITLDHFEGNIEFRNVWFYYVEGEWILKDISFKINKGETVAFVGSTGSGKSTILNLIVRNYEIIKGDIFLDGINSRLIKRQSIRKFVGQMLQDVFLFTGSIYENITLKDESITLEEVKENASYVGVSDFIEGLPGKYDYQVIERGDNFSTGQRQLISFARALCYKPTLMILDEATANIDSESEAIIQESLKKLSNISTMIIVAHRISTIQYADKIIVIKKGEIIEIGNHQQLLKNKNIYYHLYMLQYKNKEEDSSTSL
jgi:ATP-binding cassette subfamily B protein